MDELDQLIAEPHQETISKMESLGRGAVQGVTLGFGDEIGGALRAAQTAYGSPQSLGQRYAAERDALRAKNEAAEKAHPGVYATGNIAAGIIPGAAVTLLTGGAGAIPLALGEGALSGAGYSNESSAKGLARDSGTGLGLGIVGSALGSATGRLLKGVAGKAGQKAAAAATRAEEQAAGEIGEQLGSASGAFGSEVQKGSRYLENVARLKASMTPEQLAAYEELHASGQIPELERSIAQNTLNNIPGQLGKIAEKKSALEILTQNAPKLIEDRAAQLKQPSFGKDAASLMKSYGEGPAAALLAHAVGVPGLDTAAGLMFSRTRMGKAIGNRVMRPGNQIAVQNAIQGLASAPVSQGRLGQLFRAALAGSTVLPASAAASSAMDGPGAQSDEDILNSLAGATP